MPKLWHFEWLSRIDSHSLWLLVCIRSLISRIKRDGLEEWSKGQSRRRGRAGRAYVFAKTVIARTSVRLIDRLLSGHVKASMIRNAFIGHVGVLRWSSTTNHASLFGLRAQARHRKNVALLAKWQAMTFGIASARIERVAFSPLRFGLLHWTFLALTSKKKEQTKQALELRNLIINCRIVSKNRQSSQISSREYLRRR